MNKQSVSISESATEPAWHLSHPKILRPYEVQLEALRRSNGKKKFGYWLEQGLGKTALFLNDYVDRYTEFDTVFVICPNSFKLDWGLAPGQWGLGFSASVWPTDVFRVGRTSVPHFNILNFEAVRGRGYDVVRDYLDKRPCVLLVDESSAIKNFKSDTARAVMDLAKRAEVVRLLNGTPLVQNVLDLFPQLKCLGELDKMNPYAFRNRFAMLGGYMGKKVIGVRNEDELHEIQERCSFRALKKDWSDLPPKIQVPLRLEMTKNQKRHYREMYEDFYTMVQEKEFDASIVLHQMDKLRQITSGILINGNDYVLIDKPSDNPKIKAAIDILAVGSGKMIVVHFYRQMGFVLEEEFAKQGFQPAFIRGGMKPEELIAQKARFNQDSDCRVIVCQIQTASMAHTLLGGPGRDRCHLTFYHDHTFSLKDRAQMDDRNHRGEQDHIVNIYDPIMSEIDEVQLKALDSKRDMASLVVDAVRARRTL
jgi:hypothetical protein